MPDENPLASLSDEELKRLGGEIGLDVTLPSDVEGIVYVGEEEPEPPTPGLLVVRNAYGPGAHSVKFPDGTPVGVYVAERNMSPSEVKEMLEALGLEPDITEFFVRNRREAIRASGQIAEHPATKSFAASEALHETQVASFREQFLKSQQKKT